MKRHLASFLACLSCWWVSVSPATSAPNVAPADGHRFLFIVDMSEDMESLKDPLEATIYDLIRSGLYGQMQTGDTFGLWTFDKLPHAGKFPVQVWDARKATSIGAVAAAHLSNHNYERSADLKPVTELLMTVIQAVTNLNVFVISDGASMRGTPFDKAINAEYKKKRRERSSAKRPFVTTLIARGSQVISNSVVIAGQPIVLPERPLPPAITAKNTVPAPYRPPGILLSNSMTTAIVPSATLQKPLASAPVATNAGAIHEPPSNVVAKSEIPRTAVIQIITKSNNAPAVIERTSPEPGERDIALASESAPANNQPLEPPVAGPPSPESTVPEPQENAPPQDALAAILSAPITVAARERRPEPETISPVPPAAASVAGLAVPPVLGAGFFLTFGSLLMAAALFLLFVVSRRMRPTSGSSLITQSMERR